MVLSQTMNAPPRYLRFLLNQPLFLVSCEISPTCPREMGIKHGFSCDLRNAPPASAVFWSLIVTGTLASNNQVALMAFISQSTRGCFPSCCLRLFSLCLKKGWGFYSSVSRLPQHSASSHFICHFHSLVSQTGRRSFTSCFKVLLNSSSLETEYFLTIIVSYVGPLFRF